MKVILGFRKRMKRTSEFQSILCSLIEYRMFFYSFNNEYHIFFYTFNNDGTWLLLVPDAFSQLQMELARHFG